MTPWRLHTKKLAEPGLKYSSLIPNNLTAALSIKIEKHNKNKPNIIQLAMQYWWLNSTSSTVRVCHICLERRATFPALPGQRALRLRVKSLWKKPSINSLYKCQGWFPPPWAAWLAVPPPPRTAVNLAKSTCPAPSFNCHEFSRLI